MSDGARRLDQAEAEAAEELRIARLRRWQTVSASGAKPCADCGEREGQYETAAGLLCMPCEYARIQTLPADALWSPKKGADVAERWFKLHGDHELTLSPRALTARRGRRGRKAHKSRWARPEPGAVSGPVQVLASQQREREAVYGPPGSDDQHICTAYARGQ